MNNTINNYIFIDNIRTIQSKSDNLLNNKRILNQIKINKLTNIEKYDYLDEYENHQIIKFKLLEWELKDDKDIEKLIKYIFSNNWIENYYGNFYINKIFNLNANNLNLIIKLYDNNILKNYEEILLKKLEPELQFIVLNNWLYMIDKNNLIIKSILKKNMILKLKNILLTTNIFKLKIIILYIFSLLSNISENSSLKIYNLDMLDYYIQDIYDNFKKYNYLKILTNTILNIINYVIIEKSYILKILKISKQLILNNYNKELNLICIKIICVLLDYSEVIIFNDKNFFVTINNFIKENINIREYLINNIYLLFKFSLHDNFFIDLILLNGFNNLLVPILKKEDERINDLIFIMVNNFLSGSKEQFFYITNIPGLYSYYSSLIFSKNNKNIKEILKFFLNFIKYLDLENIKYLLKINYFKIIFYYLNKEQDKILIVLILMGLRDLLEYEKNINDKLILEYIISNGIDNKIIDLQEHPNKRIYNWTLDILEKYFDVE